MAHPGRYPNEEDLGASRGVSRRDLLDVGEDDGEEGTTWDIAERTEIAPGYYAWDLLSVGRRFEMWVAWCSDRLTPVCVKIPRSDQMTTRTIDALRREHQAATAFDHPAIPRVFGADLDAPRPYLIHEFIEGKPLSMILDDDGPFNAHDLVILALQIAAALRHIHGRGFVHLDLKPSNVALRGDRAIVFDFDISLPVGVQRSKTKPRGTRAYMAPEQIRCEPAHPSMDLFALGALLYEAASGVAAFDGDPTSGSDASAGFPRSFRQTDCPAPRVTDLVTGLAPSVTDIIDRLMAADPADRPSSAAETIRLLDAALPDDPESLWPSWVGSAVLGPRESRVRTAPTTSAVG